jgi:hypothetical protein
MAGEGNAVVGAVQRARLSAALTAIHRGGHGHNARVLDGARGDLRSQLRRAGIADGVGVDPPAGDGVLVLIHAPGRTAQASELLRRAGADTVYVVSREEAMAPVLGAVARPRSRSSPAAEGPAAPGVSD